MTVVRATAFPNALVDLARASFAGAVKHGHAMSDLGLDAVLDHLLALARTTAAPHWLLPVSGKPRET